MKLLGISGKKQSGKDTVMEIIKSILRESHIDGVVIRLNFADELKREVAIACNVSLHYIEQHKENFRLIMQGWGTDYRRGLYGTNYWIDKWNKALQVITNNIGTYNVFIICTDVRFPNEADCIKSNNGLLWRVDRQTSSQDKHASETQLDNIRDWDGHIINTNIPSLVTQVKQLTQEQLLK